MIHPHVRVVHISENIGDGVVATRAIPKGTIVWTQDVLDRVFEPEALVGLSSDLRHVLTRYAHIDDRGRFVLCWDAGKLINHSCEPTLRGVGPWFQVARRDIAVGEELTCDYAECNLDEVLHCTCGSTECRERVHAGDLVRFAAAWDAEAHELLDAVASVPQPLWPFLVDPAEAEAFVHRQRPLPSFRVLYSGTLG